MGKRGEEVIDIACVLQGETAAAYRIFDGRNTVWVPKSQCEMENDKGRVWICTLPTWLAKEKGLI